MKHYQQLLMSGLLALSLNAGAADYGLVDHQTYVTDTINQTDWLKLSFTQDMTFNEVQNSLPTTFTGWHIATLADWVSIFRSRGYGIGGTTKSSYVSPHYTDPFFETLVTDLSITQTGSGQMLTRGLFSDVSVNNNVTANIGGSVYYSNSLGQGFANTSSFTSGLKSPVFGTYLIRVSAVDEPQTMGLMLAGLVILRLKRNSKSS